MITPGGGSGGRLTVNLPNSRTRRRPLLNGQHDGVIPAVGLGVTNTKAEFCRLVSKPTPPSS